MPPKKAAKEEKILLGRPGNNLKSGIVCYSAVGLYEILTSVRLVLPTSGNPHSFKLSPNVTLEILP
jgi:obg-like ATPase 1